MTLRELAPHEWQAMADHEDMNLMAPCIPPDSRIVVVEDRGGQVIGTWAVIRYVHVEGLWIAPEYRKRGGRVGAYLLEGIRRVARAWGASTVWTGCMDDDIRALLKHIGAVQLPGDHFVFPVEHPGELS